jgi:hypothetical protein
MILLVAALAALPCELPEPAVASSPPLAEAFLAVAQEEAARGEVATALQAAREALRHDPASAAARELFLRHCIASTGSDSGTEIGTGSGRGEPSDDDLFDLLLGRLDAGDSEGLLALSARLPGRVRQARDAELALLEGIALYGLDRLDEAAPLLRRAERTSSLGGQASLYLGLIAWRQGDRSEAQARLSAVAGGADPRLRLLTSDLVRQARRDGRLVVQAGVDARYDSNVGLLPDGSSDATASDDVAAVVSASVSGRPLGTGRGPSLGVGLLYRAQLTLPGESFGGVSASALWSATRGRLGGSVEAGWETDWLGGAAYLHAPRFGLAGNWEPSRPIALRASYRARIERFIDDAYAGYSGHRHTGTLEAGLQRPRFGAWLSWRAERDATSDELNDFIETGPGLQLYALLPGDLRAGLLAAAGGRSYWLRDKTDARRDALAQGEVWLERDLSTHLTLRAAGGGWALSSSADGASYSNLYGSLGLSFRRGWL